nr:NAD(+) synthase [Candidatus Aenigmarchaeota archaeon]
MKKTRDKIEKWILSKVRAVGAKGCVFGMSGGLDSSVLAVLAKRSLGRKALGLVLPCESDTRDREFALEVAKRFSVNVREVDLTMIYNMLLNILPKGDEISKGNLKARLRMIVLYYFANKKKYLVLGTGNRSELLLGYFTKYGDGGVDLLPLGGLYKT